MSSSSQESSNVLENEQKRKIKISKAVQQDRINIENILSEAQAFSRDEVMCALELFDEYIKLGSQPDEYIFECARKENQEVIGFVCYGGRSLCEGVYDLYWVAVDIKARSCGVGKMLINGVDQALKKLNARMLLAETSSRADYESTRIFYEKVGFNRVSVLPDLYREGEDLLIYAKKYS